MAEPAHGAPLALSARIDGRALLWQALVLAAVGGGLWWLVANTLHNLEARQIAAGFGFLGREAGFSIGESPIAYGPT
ncbi:MAG: amino acid ABC transporter permease, partial [Tagaea sp.]